MFWRVSSALVNWSKRQRPYIVGPIGLSIGVFVSHVADYMLSYRTAHSRVHTTNESGGWDRSSHSVLMKPSDKRAPFFDVAGSSLFS